MKKNKPAPTEEQQRILSTDVNLLMIRAYAGTGKTWTLEAYARSRPRERFLCIVFNKATSEELKRRMPPNVRVSTSHALAYKAIGHRYKHKLRGNWRLTELRKAIGEDTPYETVAIIRNLLHWYLVSADTEIHQKHLPHDAPEDARAQSELLEQARLIFERMKDTEDEEVAMTHDGYLKLFQLQNPDFSKEYDRLLLDEYQDTNPVTSELVISQRMPRIIVGDPHQQLYAFRGAVDAMSQRRPDAELPLTHSFRFGSQVADLSNIILKRCKADPGKIKGAGPDTQIGKLSLSEGKIACLHRTFAWTFATAVGCVKRNALLYWVGGIERYQLGDIEDLYHLYKEENDRIQDHYLRKSFNTFAEYEQVAEESGDVEMKKIKSIVETYENDIPSLLEAIRAHTVKNIEDAHVVLSTVHRAKGEEWDQVMIASDLYNPLELKGKARKEETHILYVAITRAIRRLYVPEYLFEGFFERKDEKGGRKEKELPTVLQDQWVYCHECEESFLLHSGTPWRCPFCDKDAALESLEKSEERSRANA